MKKSLLLSAILLASAAWAQSGAGYMTLEEYLRSPGVKPQPRASVPAVPPPASTAPAPSSSATVTPTPAAPGALLGGRPKHVAPSAGGSVAAEPVVPVPQFNPQPQASAVLSSPPPAAAAAFEVRRGETLRATLQRWTEQAGWQPLAWMLDSDMDYELQASATFSGDFVSSVQALVDAIGTQVPLRAQFHHGNRLLVLEPLK
jgi:hypothetical protein